ncbi:MAG: glycosyltransferase family 39 protein, partial [Candidatus Eremiobacteraeota bacterium]|nr:glycosyltransferase family 39 protein [Candidatus Eremiobacteraeota bacterium]
MNLRRVVVICSLVAIAFGMLARLSHLDTKLFWQDEAIAALRIGGHTVAEYQTLFDGRVHPASQMAAMQRLTPGRGPAATIASIAKEEPQRSPLYYGAARIWAGLFGDGVVSLRAFSAVIGLAGIGLAFGFGSALMRTSLGGYILAALVAVSPFHIRYSQQVREFVLFTDSILLAGWLFVRVLERPTLRRWIAFGLAATFGLYADPQFAFVLAGFGIVALTMSGRVFLGFLTTAAAAFVAYSPWLDVNAHLASRTSLGLAWAASPYSLRSFAVKWAFNLGAVFFDADLAHVWLGFALVPILVLLGYAGLRLLRHHYRPADTIALSLLLCTSVPLMIADFIKHAHYETVARYEVATWVGIETAVAFALTLWLRSESVRSRTFATAAFLYLIVCGSMSAALQSSYVVWWDNNEHVDESAIATAITPPYATVVAERSHGVYV